MNDLRTLLRAVVEDHHTLPRPQARALLTTLLAEPTLTEHTAAELSSLLTALALRGETPEELAGFVDAMRLSATPLPLTPEERIHLVDTCGTGGDSLRTFNISTAAALVAASAGARVAKHGNRAVTSRSGSADVLELLGVPIDLPPDQAADCLRQTGFVFLLAPTYHPALRRLAPVRRALPFRTLFHLAGPLSNPAGAPAQVMGLYAPSRIPTVARAMQLLGVRQALVVHGDGLDELTTTGPTHFAHLTPSQAEDSPPPTLQTLTPEALGLPRAPLSALQLGDSPEQSAAAIQLILHGQGRTPHDPVLTHRRNIVLLNAAAALLVAGLAPSLPAALELAAHAIDSGATARLLTALRSFHP